MAGVHGVVGIGADWLTVARVLAHGVIGPGWLLLAVGEWNRGRRRLPWLFVLFGLERYLVLTGLAVDLITPGSWAANRGLLTPVTVAEAGVMVWLVWRSVSR